MKYLLDSNAIIRLVARFRPLVERVQRLGMSECAMSSVTAFELHFGAAKSRRRAHNQQVVDGLRLEILAFDQEDARTAGHIRAALVLAGRPIGPYDLLIAGQAMSRNMTLVTHNVAEFSRVEGLRIEDWES